MEICEYNFLFIVVLNSVALMYLEFSAASLAITLLDSDQEIEINYKVTGLKCDINKLEQLCAT